jgi:RNA polymerase sigma-70 factor (ECF subfamily)
MESMAIGQGMAEIPDEALVAASRSGDREAFSLLVERHRELAFACALAYMRDREEAEDVAQEAFSRAYASLATFRGGVWQGWFMRILRNLCLDTLRRRKVRKTEPIDVNWLDQSPSPEAQVLEIERRRHLAWAIGTLPEKFRVPLVMHFLSQRTYREIAVALGLPETTVVGRTTRAVRLLRERLEAEP